MHIYFVLSFLVPLIWIYLLHVAKLKFAVPVSHVLVLFEAYLRAIDDFSTVDCQALETSWKGNLSSWHRWNAKFSPVNVDFHQLLAISHVWQPYGLFCMYTHSEVLNFWQDVVKLRVFEQIVLGRCVKDLKLFQGVQSAMQGPALYSCIMEFQPLQASALGGNGG